MSKKNEELSVKDANDQKLVREFLDEHGVTNINEPIKYQSIIPSAFNLDTPLIRALDYYTESYKLVKGIQLYEKGHLTKEELDFVAPNLKERLNQKNKLMAEADVSANKYRKIFIALLNSGADTNISRRRLHKNGQHPPVRSGEYLGNLFIKYAFDDIISADKRLNDNLILMKLLEKNVRLDYSDLRKEQVFNLLQNIKDALKDPKTNLKSVEFFLKDFQNRFSEDFKENLLEIEKLLKNRKVGVTVSDVSKTNAKTPESPKKPDASTVTFKHGQKDHVSVADRKKLFEKMNKGESANIKQNKKSMPKK